MSTGTRTEVILMDPTHDTSGQVARHPFVVFLLSIIGFGLILKADIISHHMNACPFCCWCCGGGNKLRTHLIPTQQ